MPAISFSELRTEHLLLRQLKEEDAEFIFRLRSNDEVNKFINRPISTSIKEAVEFIKNINDGIHKNGWMYWLIVLKNENKPVGTITLWQFSKEKRCAEIGYEMIPEYQGKGIMQQAIKKVIDYAFNSFHLQKLYAWTHRNNKASLKLLEKNNFQRDINEEKLHAENEELENMVIYSRIF